MIANADCGAVMLTLAPNRVRAEIIGALAARGVLVSLGHAEAAYEEAQAGLAAGARAFTHLFNAMSPLQGREPGMVGAALDAQDSLRRHHRRRASCASGEPSDRLRRQARTTGSC